MSNIFGNKMIISTNQDVGLVDMAAPDTSQLHLQKYQTQKLFSNQLGFSFITYLCICCILTIFGHGNNYKLFCVTFIAKLF
jgi:hypothetical protein